MQHGSRSNPWDGVQEALATFGSNLEQAAQHVERQVLQPWQRNMGKLVQGMQQLMVQQQMQHQQRQQQQQQQRHLLAPLAVSFCQLDD